MKYITVLIQCVLIVGMSFATMAYGADVARIGVVDYQRILKECMAGKDIAKKLRQKQDERTSALESRRSEIVSLQKSIDIDHSGDKDNRDKKKMELSKKLEAFKDEETRFNTQLKDLNAQQASLIKDGISQVIDKIGKKGGYLLILEKTDTLYAPASTDITSQVIEEYDMAYQQRK